MEADKVVKELIDKAMAEGLSLEIVYANSSGEESTRVISDISLSDEYGSDYISAYCHLRKERCTFNMARIFQVRIVAPVSSDLAAPSGIYRFNPNKPIFNLFGDSY